MPFRQRLEGLIEPRDPDFRNAPTALKKKWYEGAGYIALDEWKQQLLKGIGANGQSMKPRIQAVLPDGADGPVMIPHYDASRAITLSDFMATSGSLTMFVHAGTGHRSYKKALKAFKAGKRKNAPAKFNDILGYHADGLVRGAPKRDVRLCKARQRNIQRRGEPLWAQIKKAAGWPNPTPTPQRKGPQPRAKGTVEVGGAKFKPGEKEAYRGEVVVMVSVDRLDAQLRANAGYHVGPGGTGASARPSSYEIAARDVARSRRGGGEIVMPSAYVDTSGNVSLADGRHRFAALRDAGFSAVPVTVPRRDAARVRKLVGASARPAIAHQHPTPTHPVPVYDRMPTGVIRKGPVLVVPGYRGPGLVKQPKAR